MYLFENLAFILFCLIIARTPALVPSITHRTVQGVLVRFFPNGDKYHRGVKIAINQFELKSWEAFLNYLDRLPKLRLSTGSIQHIYSLTGQEIRAINQFQSCQSYIVASGAFTPTDYHSNYDSFAEESGTNVNASKEHYLLSYRNVRLNMYSQWHLPLTMNSEQVFLLPYSKLNMYEVMILNRNVTQTFEEWLHDQVTDLLSQHTNYDIITHLFGMTEYTFMEVKSFSKLFNTVKITDVFIACTEDEYVHAKHYLGTIRPYELFVDSRWPRRRINRQHQRIPSKRSTNF